MALTDTTLFRDAMLFNEYDWLKMEMTLNLTVLDFPLIDVLPISLGCIPLSHCQGCVKQYLSVPT